MLGEHIELADYEKLYGALPTTLLAKTISAEEAMQESDYQSSSDPSDASDEPARGPAANKKKLAAAEALRKEQQNQAVAAADDLDINFFD